MRQGPIGRARLTGPYQPARAAVVALALGVAAVSCAPGDGPHVEGAAPPVTRDAQPVYVNDAAGEPLQRPERFGITEFVSLVSLTWDSWGGPEASAVGRVRGMWCLPDCPEGGYPATVELREPVVSERVGYYTRATVTSDALPSEMDLDDLLLYVPGQDLDQDTPGGPHDPPGGPPPDQMELP